MSAQAKTVQHPNLYELHGDTISVVYSASGFDGKPHFSYQDASESLQFSGDQINVAQTELGELVSVFLRRTVDQGATTFTVLLPRVNLRFFQSAQISTIGVTALHRFSIIGVPNGQQDLYRSHHLTGSASFAVF